MAESGSSNRWIFGGTKDRYTSQAAGRVSFFFGSRSYGSNSIDYATGLDARRNDCIWRNHTLITVPATRMLSNHGNAVRAIRIDLLRLNSVCLR